MNNNIHNGKNASFFSGIGLEAFEEMLPANKADTEPDPDPDSPPPTPPDGGIPSPVITDRFGQPNLFPAEPTKTLTYEEFEKLIEKPKKTKISLFGRLSSLMSSENPASLRIVNGAAAIFQTFSHSWLLASLLETKKDVPFWMGFPLGFVGALLLEFCLAIMAGKGHSGIAFAVGFCSALFTFFSWEKFALTGAFEFILTCVFSILPPALLGAISHWEYLRKKEAKDRKEAERMETDRKRREFEKMNAERLAEGKVPIAVPEELQKKRNKLSTEEQFHVIRLIIDKNLYDPSDIGKRFGIGKTKVFELLTIADSISPERSHSRPRRKRHNGQHKGNS